jgi:outer membrane lipopolysaccharide assembly protein LptE/RlpB
MFKNKIIFIFIITFLSSCGYTPVYVNNNNVGEFQIEMVEFKGDQLINKFINFNLKQYYKHQGSKKYSITMKSKYLKSTISKDKTGATTEYKLNANVEFKIILDEGEKYLNFNEFYYMKSMDNLVDERDYERNLIQSLSSNITQELLTELSKL